MGNRQYVAEIKDPVTGEVTTLTASTEAELDRAVEEHFAQSYPDPQ